MGVGVGLGVLVGLGVGVDVLVGDDVGVGVGVLAGVWVAVNVRVGVGVSVLVGDEVGVGDGVLVRAGVGTGDWVRGNNAWAIPAVIVGSTSSSVVEVSPQADSVSSTVSARMIDRWNICCRPSLSTRLS